MTSGSPQYLTVNETAELLRTVPQTVYRWCRSGRLKAVKVGKEWRIPADQIRPRQGLAGLMLLKDLLARLAGQPEHLLGLASDRAALARLESTFFEVAAAAGGHLVRTRWTEGPEEMRRRLRPVLGSRATSRAGVRFLNFADAYERQGLTGPRGLLAAEVDRANARGRFCYAYGSCFEYFGYHYDRLAAFEAEIIRDLGDLPLVYLCGFPISDLYEVMPIPTLLELVACHGGTIVFDGQRALLQRPA